MTHSRTPQGSPGPSVSSRREWIGLAAIFLGIVWFYAYVGVKSFADYQFISKSGDYYHKLVDGFLDGQAGFKERPPAALVELKDPYDPVQRAAAGNVGLHDATYYKGRYYLYFGAAPALVLLVPFKLLTGVQFPQGLATVVLCAGGLASSIGLLLDVRRRFFPGCRPRWIWLGAWLLGLGNFCAPLVARNSIWEVPIAGAYCFSSLACWMLFKALLAGNRRCWYVAASLAFGLAVASRPHFVLLGVAMGGVWLWDLARRKRRGEALSIRTAAGEFGVRFLPLVACILALLCYNYARFDSFLEFGTKYQLAGYNQFNAQWFSLRFLPANFYYYLLAPAQVSRYFPFFEVVKGYPGTLAADYGGIEDPYGILSNFPFVWLAAATPLLCLRWRRGEPLLARWLAVLGGAFGLLCFVTLCFSWATNRYMVDFLPPLLTVAAVGVLLVAEPGMGSGWARLLGRVAVFGAVLFTAAFNLLVAFQHNGLYKAHRPEDFARLAGLLNRPALWWEQHFAQPYGPVEFTVRFPPDRPGRAEPLLVTGVSYKSDYIYVYYYPDLQSVQLAFTLTNRAHLLSQAIPVDLSQLHRIGIASGALYPEATHPYFAGWKPEDVKAAKRTLRVTLDGVPYLEAEAEFYEGSPGFVTIGENRLSKYIEPKFTGQITDVRRQPLAKSVAEFNGGGFLRLAVALPAPAAGRAEPIVATRSRSGRVDLLYYEFVDSTSIRFGLAETGAAPLTSAAFPVKPADLQLIEASLGSFYREPDNARDRELQGQAVVRLNDRTVWTVPRAFAETDGTPPVIGRNPGLAGVGPAFSGRIAAQLTSRPFPSGPVSRFAVQPHWLEAGPGPAFGPVRVHFTLPARPVSKLEPFVVTGTAPILADHLAINYTVAGRLGVNYIHAGNAGPQSARVAVDPTALHVMEADLPSMYPSESDSFFARASLGQIASAKRGRARVVLDGRQLFDTAVGWAPSPADWITIGSDRVNQMYGQRFSGTIVAVERMTYGPIPGLEENQGPLEISLVYPGTVSAEGQVILGTGSGAARDTLTLLPDAAGKLRYRVKLAQGGEFTSGPVARDERKHVLQVQWGGLNPDELRPPTIPEDQWRARQKSFKVVLDGTELLAGTGEFYRGVAPAVTLGAAIGDLAGFTGRIQAIRRLP
jgi:hypothetical protein